MDIFLIQLRLSTAFTLRGMDALFVPISLQLMARPGEVDPKTKIQVISPIYSLFINLILIQELCLSIRELRAF